MRFIGVLAEKEYTLRAESWGQTNCYIRRDNYISQAASPDLTITFHKTQHSPSLSLLYIYRYIRNAEVALLLQRRKAFLNFSNNAQMIYVKL